jgi:molybdate-binding protein/DNA-binding XRE family transcriptional regulator
VAPQVPVPLATRGRLRLTRLARALSQEQLAQASGVSRQAIAGVESGRWAPSLKVALAIARALGSSVEEIFGADAPLPRVDAVVVSEEGRSTAGGRAALAAVMGRLVAYPLSNDSVSDFGFRPASAVVAPGTIEAQAAQAGPAAQAAPGAKAGPATGSEPGAGSISAHQIAPLRPTVVVAGCDPALPLLSVPLGRLDSPLDLLWWPCGSGTAAELLLAGLIHVAGVHHPGPGQGATSRRGARDAAALRGALDTVTIGFAGWREGLVARPELVDKVKDLSDVARLGLLLVNRERGSEARNLLERECHRLRIATRHLAGYDSAVTGHLQLASAIRSGLGDVGVASEPAAIAYGLAFVPLVTERCDLVVRRAALHSPEVQGLLLALQSGWLRPQLDALPGYDATVCGELVEAS